MAVGMATGWIAAILLIVLGGCGGGGDSPQTQNSPPSGSSSVISWTPPAAFNDNVALDPARDLEYYEIYVRQDPNFTDSDVPAIQLAAVAENVAPDGRTVVRLPVTEFTLELIPSLPAGNQLYVSMRAVGVDQQKSTFMAPLLWNRS